MGNVVDTMLNAYHGPVPRNDKMVVTKRSSGRQRVSVARVQGVVEIMTAAE